MYRLKGDGRYLLGLLQHQGLAAVVVSLCGAGEAGLTMIIEPQVVPQAGGFRHQLQGAAVAPD